MKWPFVSRKRHDMLFALAIRQNEEAFERQLSLIDAKREAVRAVMEQVANAEAALKAMTEDRNKWRDKAAKYKSHIDALEAHIQQQPNN